MNQSTLIYNNGGFYTLPTEQLEGLLLNIVDTPIGFLTYVKYFNKHYLEGARNNLIHWSRFDDEGSKYEVETCQFQIDEEEKAKLFQDRFNQLLIDGIIHKFYQQIACEDENHKELDYLEGPLPNTTHFSNLIIVKY